MRPFLPPAALFALLALAAPADAATTIGSDLARDATPSSPCPAFMQPLDCTLAPTSLPAGSQAAGGLTAPAAGVVVRWRVKRSTGTTGVSLRLVVLTGNAVQARSDATALGDSAGQYTFATRVPISAGDRIAVSGTAAHGGGGLPLMHQDHQSQRVQWMPGLGASETRAPTVSYSDWEVLLNADIEPDADGDGYGDETQDACPTNASTQGTCPAPAVDPAPTTPAPTRPSTPETTPPTPTPTSPLQLPESPSADPTPAVTLGRAPTRVDARGRVAVRLGCEQASGICRPQVDIFRGTGAQKVRLARVRPRIAAGEDRTLRLQLPAATRRLLRAGRALTVHLVVTPETGAPVRRTLRLRAA